MKNDDKETIKSEAYDKGYYTDFLRTHEEFSDAGVLSGYDVVLRLLAPQRGEKILDIGEVGSICS